jgi:hypothetical protein
MKKITCGTINSVSYDVLKHIHRLLRYGRDQEVVNVVTYTVADLLNKRHGNTRVREPQMKNRWHPLYDAKNTFGMPLYSREYIFPVSFGSVSSPLHYNVK